MRVLSFIPAFLLAATSFVAAAPTATSSVPVPSSVTSCAPSTSEVPSASGVPSTSGSGNDAPLQPVIAILVNATSALQAPNTQLTSLQSSGTPDVNTVSGVIVQVTAIVQVTVGQLNAVGSISLDGLDLTSTCSAIYALLALVLAILNSVVLIATSLTGSAIISLQGVVTGLLGVVLDLVACLQIFVTASTSGILGPVLVVIKSNVDFLLAIFVGVQVLVGVSN